MKERSLLLTKENRAKVRAGLKTHTRRVIVPQPNSDRYKIVFEQGVVKETFLFSGCTMVNKIFKPRYAVGDELWMLEPYQILRTWYDKMAIEGVYLDTDEPFGDDGMAIWMPPSEWKRRMKRKWPHRKTSSRFMYKSLTRTWVKVIRAWVERVQDISPEDILAEGLGSDCWDYAESDDGTGDMFMYADHTIDPPSWCSENMTSCECIEDIFSWLWDSINKKRGFGWDVNPWVFCYEWEVMQK